jgi:hypothetical protein
MTAQPTAANITIKFSICGWILSRNRIISSYSSPSFSFWITWSTSLRSKLILCINCHIMWKKINMIHSWISKYTHNDLSNWKLCLQGSLRPFRKCTASIKDTDDRASSPYCAFNPQRISAGLTLFHQESDDPALFYTRNDKVWCYFVLAHSGFPSIRINCISSNMIKWDAWPPVRQWVQCCQNCP